MGRTSAEVADKSVDLYDILVQEEAHPELQTLLIEAASHNDAMDFSLIRRSYHFAARAHRDQVRESGRPFIHHCVGMARILANLRLDATTISAGLLHDMLEDTGVTYDQVCAEFGEEIAALVDGVTKIKALNFQSQEARQAENFRKMLISMVKDIRVILMKFADRLHNMRTLKHLDEARQRRIALETRDVYAPLAHRLGIARIRWELEDLSLKYLDTEAYESIREKIALSREEREMYIEEIKAPLEKELKSNGIEAEITGRPKNFYSIYNKMKIQNRPFEEVYDLLAIRTMVNTVRDCYFVLGLVHSIYTPITERFRDFIATPKSNMYQSLHTTVVGPRGLIVEIQIRTKEMHQTSEVGIAAHWRYKEGRGKESDLDRQVAWLRQVMEWQSDTVDPSEFMEQLKIDLFQDEIFVFTPKGDLIQLPRGASPLDFAFAVHTDIGLHCLGAKVNGPLVPLGHLLNSGDSVEIITSPHQKPNRSWLDLVKTSKARSRIRRWLKDESYAHSVQLGGDILNHELRRNRANLKEEELLDVALSCGMTEVERLYAAIGSGEISVNRVMGKILPKEQKAPRKSYLSELGAKAAAKGKGVRIQGMDNMMIVFGKCCNPIPGDPIIGLITRGRGVSIHRTDCSNMSNILSDKERIIMVAWDVDKNQSFATQIVVKGQDRTYFLSDITKAISDSGANIISSTTDTKDGAVDEQFLIEVRNVQHLRSLMKKIRKIQNVTKVRRLDQLVLESEK